MSRSNLFASEVVNDTPYEVYDLMDGHRASNIKYLWDDPRDYRDFVYPSYYLRTIKPGEGSRTALERGSLVDDRVFRRKRRWKVTMLNKNSNDFKALAEKWPDMVWVKERGTFGGESQSITRSQLVGMCRNVMECFRSEFGKNWREDGHVQYSIRWTHEVSGFRIPMKMLGDYFNGCYIDLKTTGWPRDPLRACDDYGYDLKDAHYRHGHEAAGLPVGESKLLWVSSTYPYRARLWTMPDWMREKAMERYQSCMWSLMRGLRDGEWDAPIEASNEEPQPGWHAYRYGEVEIVDFSGVEVIQDD